MEQSILKSTKKILGIAPDDPSFDLDVITHINSAFSTLHELGVGPGLGLVIEDDEAVWDDFQYEDAMLGSHVRTYIFLKTRLLFDPPTVSYLLDAMTRQLQEVEWRISVRRENLNWVDPNPIVVVEPDDRIDLEIIDIEGGTA